jgi:aryl-alcohol dehydrogenase-like predicted oxidoreductase
MYSQIPSRAGAYGAKLPDEERLAFLDKVYDLGEWFWDAADIYADCEDIIGKWLAANPEKRKDIFLATKFGNRMLDTGYGVDSTPGYCKQAVEKSLSRLGVSHIDLYYCHRVDGNTPIEQTMRALADLKAEGKIKYIGLSEISAATVHRACKIARVDAVQIEYSPWFLDVENPQIGLLQACRELGVATIAYSPIGRGMLSGAIRSLDDLGEKDSRRMSPRFSPENFSKNLVLVDNIVEFARKKEVTAAQLVLAWLMAQGPDIIPIPGTTKIERLKENLSALEIKLSDEEIKEIRKMVEAAEVHGNRYANAALEYTFGDTPDE